MGASNKYATDMQLEEIQFNWLVINGGQARPLSVRILGRDRDVYLDIEGGNRIPKLSERQARSVEELRAAGLDEEPGPRDRAVRGEVEAAPDPGNEVAPVVEVPVRDGDGVDVRPRLRLAETAEDAGPAVEEELLRAFDEVPGMRASRVRPRRRGADDGQAHRGILPMCRADVFEW